MKGFLFVLIVFSLFSCKEFETKKLSSSDIVEEEIKHIDWKNLDTYPSFDECDQYSIKSEKQNCFENEITKHIFEVLMQNEVVLKDSIREEVILNILISKEGKPSIKNISVSDTLLKQIPELETWLIDAVADLPKIHPAEKRGIPVSSNFKLPLVIQSE